MTRRTLSGRVTARPVHEHGPGDVAVDHSGTPVNSREEERGGDRATPWRSAVCLRSATSLLRPSGELVEQRQAPEGFARFAGRAFELGGEVVVGGVEAEQVLPSATSAAPVRVVGVDAEHRLEAARRR